MTAGRTLPPELFDREDSSPDSTFYAMPRLVTHIDDATIDALTTFYDEVLGPGYDVLDLMSSWVSHLPPGLALGRVAGLGMNAAELAANPQLGEWVVHDLNEEPDLPFGGAEFDAVLNAVSVQYLTNPVPVFRAIRRVLRTGGLSIVAMSHRCFPTKAVRAFHVLSGEERQRLVARYHELAGGFEEIEYLDHSPVGADPLWLVVARAGKPSAG